MKVGRGDSNGGALISLFRRAIIGQLAFGGGGGMWVFRAAVIERQKRNGSKARAGAEAEEGAGAEGVGQNKDNYRLAAKLRLQGSIDLLSPQPS